MVPRPPDLGRVWALFQSVRRRYEDGSARPVERHDWAWNVLGCAIPLAIFLMLFTLLWFVGLGDTFSHYFGR